MEMNIVQAEDQNWTVRKYYLNLLQAAVDEELPEREPHVEIGQVLVQMWS